MSKVVGVVKVAPTDREAMTYLGKGLPGRPGVGENYTN